jgi:hypothetical protein
MKPGSWLAVMLPVVCFCALALLALPLPAAENDEEPEYPHGDFAEDCELCHQAAGWRPVQISDEFDHGKRGFPLLGAHASATCRACHVSLEFTVADDDCVGCHMDIHQGELGTDCRRCHTNESFIDRAWMRRAHVVTLFPLRGAHLPLDCEDCHPPAPQGMGQFVLTPVDCEACHLDLFMAVQDPDHQAGGFPTDCNQCHGQVAWERFDHNSLLPCENCHMDDYLATTDPNHQTLGLPTDCADCHTPVDWERFDHNTTVECRVCHMDKYLATTNPDHQSIGFNDDCAQCHTTINWEFMGGSGFDHDGMFFPIYSGKHAGRWDTCNECHTTPGNFSSFTCLECHPHSDEIKTNADHSEEPGYTYNSQACLGCHPQGDS